MSKKNKKGILALDRHDMAMYSGYEDKEKKIKLACRKIKGEAPDGILLKTKFSVKNAQDKINKAIINLTK